MKSFNKREVEETIKRVNQLTPETKQLWGQMDCAKMFAHCCVPYEMAYGEAGHQKPNGFVRFILKLFVKDSVINDKPYKKHSKTAPQFLIKSDKDFSIEKERLIAYILKTLELGEAYFEGKESLSFDILDAQEWDNLFYKHLDHHLNQFGV